MDLQHAWGPLRDEARHRGFELFRARFQEMIAGRLENFGLRETWEDAFAMPSQNPAVSAS